MTLRAHVVFVEFILWYGKGLSIRRANDGLPGNKLSAAFGRLDGVINLRTHVYLSFLSYLFLSLC